ncbi:hypothetical protein [Phytohabitans rumicis]|uniref:Uncharacterized protein n=1 Tax=Phytohabitans rumicis TaxID=1076125 RepID=A0A6V8LC32_9ACTN|nr:hypothetical protein [Phytohabitans rumicis]GFJ90235.1 hypothetical protein Prum_038770 [Phytohabitans rumicis]
MTTLDVELAAAAGRRWWNRYTVILGVALVLVGGFVAGIEVQKAYGSDTGTAAGPGGGTGQRGAGGYGGFPGGGMPTAFPGGAQGGAQGTAASNATTGTVKLVDGTTVYVQTASGELITVRTDGETAVRVPGALKDLKAGDKVSVEGATDAEGTVTAESVTESK